MQSRLYPQSDETPILMADGRTKAIAELRVGERSTRHRAKRQLPAVRHARCSITGRPSSRHTAFTPGWDRAHREWGSPFFEQSRLEARYGTEYGPLQRPHLTTNNKLMGTGGFASPPEHTPDYRRGYLCGLIRGDGHVGSYSYRAPGTGERRRPQVPACPCGPGGAAPDAALPRGRGGHA